MACLFLSLSHLGYSAQLAAERGIELLEVRVGGAAGCIAVSNKGEAGVCFNSKGMAWAVVANGQIRYGLYKGELNTRDYAPPSSGQH